MTALNELWRNALADHVEVLTWSPDGRELLAGSLSGDGVVLDATTGAANAKLAGHTFGVLSGAWRPDGAVLATGGHDGLLRLTDRSGVETAVVALDGWVSRLAWSPDGTSLAAAAGRRLHLLGSDGERRWIAEHASTVTAVAWAPNGRRVGAACYGGIAWYEPASGPTAARAFDWKGSLLSLAVSPTGRWAAAGSQDATVHIWRLWSGDDLSMSGYPAKVDHVAFAPDGRWMANACLGDITIWPFAGKGPEGTRPARAEGHDRHVTTLEWQPGGTRLASGSADGAVIIWPAPRRKTQTLRPLAGLDADAGVARVAWSPDGSRLAVAHADGGIQVGALP